METFTSLIWCAPAFIFLRETETILQRGLTSNALEDAAEMIGVFIALHTRDAADRPVGLDEDTRCPLDAPFFKIAMGGATCDLKKGGTKSSLAHRSLVCQFSDRKAEHMRIHIKSVKKHFDLLVERFLLMVLWLSDCLSKFTEGPGECFLDQQLSCEGLSAMALPQMYQWLQAFAPEAGMTQGRYQG